MFASFPSLPLYVVYMCGEGPEGWFVREKGNGTEQTDGQTDSDGDGDDEY